MTQLQMICVANEVAEVEEHLLIMLDGLYETEIVLELKGRLAIVSK